MEKEPMRRFKLQRLTDVTGISGTGIVAEGVLFTGGKIAVHWLTAVSTVVLYDNFAGLEAVTLHNGNTVVLWCDPDPACKYCMGWGTHDNAPCGACMPTAEMQVWERAHPRNP